MARKATPKGAGRRAAGALRGRRPQRRRPRDTARPFAGTAALFWSGLIYGRYGRAGYGASVCYVFTTLVHTGLLGAAFTLAAVPLYPHYAARTPDPIADQQIAGLVM